MEHPATLDALARGGNGQPEVATADSGSDIEEGHPALKAVTAALGIRSWEGRVTQRTCTPSAPP